jgi:hypothetical protein
VQQVTKVEFVNQPQERESAWLAIPLPLLALADEAIE